jgi:hypothetical protein
MKIHFLLSLVVRVDPEVASVRMHADRLGNQTGGSRRQLLL